MIGSDSTSVQYHHTPDLRCSDDTQVNDTIHRGHSAFHFIENNAVVAESFTICLIVPAFLAEDVRFMQNGRG